MARAAGGFWEEQFWEACAELKQPKLAGANWELLMEAMGICVYRLWDQVAACPLEERQPPAGSVRPGAGLLELGGVSTGAMPPADLALDRLWEWEVIRIQPVVSQKLMM